MAEFLYATSHQTGTVTNPDNALGNTPSTWAGVTNANTSATSRWAIGNPVNGLTPGATHTVRVVARKGSNTGNPTVAVNLYENGSLVKSLVGTTSVTSTTGQTLTGTFTTSQVSNKDNIEVEVVITGVGGSGSARNSAQVSHIEWEADVSVLEPVGHATATDVARALTPVKTIVEPLGRAVSTETARTLTPALSGGDPVVGTVGHAATTETARALTPVKTVYGSLGQGAAIETARSLAPVKDIVALLAATSETEDARALTPVKTIEAPLGQAPTVETARSLIPVKPVLSALGRGSTTETTRSLTPVKTIISVIGKAPETEVARSISGSTGGAAQTVILGRASETDAPRALDPVKPIYASLGQAAEADAARTASPSLGGITGTLGLAAATSVARTIVPVKTIFGALGKATESDSSRAITNPGPSQTVPLNQASEVASAPTIGASRSVVLGRANESDLGGDLFAEGTAGVDDLAWSIARLGAPLAILKHREHRVAARRKRQNRPRRSGP